MPNRLLEVGAGLDPAIQNPGTVFSAERIDYFAIDAGHVSKMIVYNKMVGLSSRAKHEYYGTACMGAMSAMPYRDGLFKHVIMKSVVGEYSLHFSRTKDPHQKGINSDQTLAETIKGFSEVFRILEPGGKLVVSEEDTPADSSRLLEHLSAVGFSSVTITPYDKRSFRTVPTSYDTYPSQFHRSLMGPDFLHADEEWLTLRGMYWSLKPRLDTYGGPTPTGHVNDVAEAYYPYSYILTARKPAEENQVDSANASRGVLLATMHQTICPAISN